MSASWCSALTQARRCIIRPASVAQRWITFALNGVSQLTSCRYSEATPSRNPRRRQRSPESAISPATRRPKKRMRPASGLTRRPDEGAEERDETARRRADSPTPSAGSFEFDEDDEDEDDYEQTGEGGFPSSGQQLSSSASASTTQPGQKPKRTRQLTTPQQAAVLHALLAQVILRTILNLARDLLEIIQIHQSRFPTTQMREEVGRQIGLSARKVQVRHSPLSSLDCDLSSVLSSFLKH